MAVDINVQDFRWGFESITPELYLDGGKHLVLEVFELGSHEDLERRSLIEDSHRG